MTDARDGGTASRASIDRKALRAARIGAREAVPLATQLDWDAAITARLAPLLLAAVSPPACVGLYWPWKAEYDPRPLALQLRAAGWITALPLVVAPQAPLAFARWDDATALVPDRFGIPTPAAPERVVPGVLVVPLNAFDARGYRLGYGGGFYDRTLAALRPRPRTFGVAYEIARVDDLAPAAHDVPMDVIVTEAGVTHFDR